MKKLTNLLLLGGLLFLGVQNVKAGADWVGNSAVYVNESWYYCGNNLGDWCTGGAFNDANLGAISSLALGGQSQVHASNNENWNSGELTMGYRIDGGSAQTITLSYESYGHGQFSNNMRYQSGGSTFSSTSIDISGLSEGKHTIAVWFGPLDGCSDGNINSNYVASFYISTPFSLSNVGEAAYGFATFCGSSNYTVSGATAYKATLNGSYLTLTALSGIIPAEAGVILVGESNAEITIAYTESDATADMGGNVLLGTTAAGTTASLLSTGEHLYAFDKTANVFREYTGANFPANKAYFKSSTAFSAPTAIRIENEATDIQKIQANENVVKFIENGKLFIMKNGEVYDLTGRVVR